jgi:hypothetical protein
MELASRIGIRKPHHFPVDSISDLSAVPEGWGFPLFLKTEHSCGGDGVTMVSDGGALKEQLQRLMCIGPGRRIASWLKRSLCTMAGFQLGSATGVLIQSHLRREYLRFERWRHGRGRVPSGISLAAQCVHPKPTGASTIVRFDEREYHYPEVRAFI